MRVSLLLLAALWPMVSVGQAPESLEPAPLSQAPLAPESPEAVPELTTPPEAVEAPPVLPPVVSPSPPTPSVKRPAAATATVLNRTPEAVAALSGWNLGVDLDTSVGQGTFEQPETSALWLTSLVVAPSYTFRWRDVKLSATGQTMLSWEHSLPDNVSGRRFSLWDSRVGLSAPAVWRERRTGIALTPRVGLLLPTSIESRFASMLTTVTAGLTLSRTFGRFDFGYQLSGGKGVHFNTQALATKSAARDPQGSLIYLGRVDEAYASSNGNNVSWSLSNTLTAICRATERISLSTSLTVINYWRYAVTESVDDLTPKALDARGNSVARVGMGRSDRLLGTLGATYSITERFGIGAGLATDGPPLTRDNRHLRFPFFDFVSANDNLTTFSLTLSAYL